MPANLTPDYERADAAYKAATTDDERMAALREMAATIPKHKGTEKLQADIKHRLSLLRKKVSKAPSRGPDPFYVPHAGAGQVVLAGLPNVGKSQLVLTASKGHAPVKVTDYPFATALPVPAMVPYEDIQLEFVDTPPVTGDHVPAGLFGTYRNADILGLVVDASTDPLEQAEELLGLLRQREVKLRTAGRDELDPADPHDHSALIIANKADLAPREAIATLGELYGPELEVLAVSAATGEGLEELLARCWRLLAAIRVYTKEPGQAADLKKPFVLPRGSTIEDLAGEIHRDLAARLKYARLWREGGLPGLQMQRTEQLQDRDVVELHQ